VGAGDAALHLVVDERRAVLVAGRAGGVQELVVEDVDAALALHRLEDHGSGALVDAGHRLGRRRELSARRCARRIPGSL